MKIRNKKTGGLANLIVDKDLLRVKTDAGWCDYGSLAELNEEWEDCEPKEPLIKDEKIRKAVRAWAEANDDSTIQLYIFDKEINRLGTDFSYIEFDDITAFGGLKDSKAYTITELCGEEEE